MCECVSVILNDRDRNREGMRKWEVTSNPCFPLQLKKTTSTIILCLQWLSHFSNIAYFYKITGQEVFLEKLSYVKKLLYYQEEKNNKHSIY